MFNNILIKLIETIVISLILVIFTIVYVFLIIPIVAVLTVIFYGFIIFVIIFKDSIDFSNTNGIKFKKRRP